MGFPLFLMQIALNHPFATSLFQEDSSYPPNHVNVENERHGAMQDG